MLRLSVIIEELRAALHCVNPLPKMEESAEKLEAVEVPAEVLTVEVPDTDILRGLLARVLT
jgi:hypothetical protein